jgi:hypothetical protein
VQEVIGDLNDLANGNPRVVPKKFKSKYKPIEAVVKTFEVQSLFRLTNLEGRRITNNHLNFQRSKIYL